MQLPVVALKPLILGAQDNVLGLNYSQPPADITITQRRYHNTMAVPTNMINNPANSIQNYIGSG